MGRISKQKRSGLKNLRSKPSLRTDLPATTIDQSTTVAAVVNNATQVPEIPQIEVLRCINAILKRDNTDSKKKFVRGLTLSKRQRNQVKRDNAEMAKGSAKIYSFFRPLVPFIATPVSEEPTIEESPVLEEAMNIYKRPVLRKIAPKLNFYTY